MLLVGEHLALDQTTFSVDSTRCLGSYTTGIDNKTPVSAMAVSATLGGVMDNGPYGVVRIKESKACTEQITVTFCDGHAARRVSPNIAGQTLGNLLRSYDHDLTRGTHRGAAASG